MDSPGAYQQDYYPPSYFNPSKSQDRQPIIKYIEDEQKSLKKLFKILQKKNSKLDKKKPSMKPTVYNYPYSYPKKEYKQPAPPSYNQGGEILTPTVYPIQEYNNDNDESSNNYESQNENNEYSNNSDNNYNFVSPEDNQETDEQNNEQYNQEYNEENNQEDSEDNANEYLSEQYRKNGRSYLRNNKQRTNDEVVKAGVNVCNKYL